MKNFKKGFTLLELLIVIGILAILATVAILVINPAELLRRARDSSRISDLSTIKSALGFYLTDAVSPNLGSGAVVCGTGTTGSPSPRALASYITETNCSKGMGFVQVLKATSTTYTNTNNTGWIPVNFSGMSTGSPLGSLPIDPTNSCASTASSNQLYYTYSCTTGLTFLLTGRLESVYYAPTDGTTGIMAKDGGTATSVYEVGTQMDIYITATSTAITSYGVL